ncbi:MAG: hypothetical protein B6245_04280 [Desulfobacteraceae bacterium 4572_88]|nr:MAG: hypothetical protein B6245_04280 [Desulfobacteraceae bacterium 4572_88]
MVDADAREDVFSTRTDGPAAEGVCQISLKDHNIRLNPGTEYEWFLIIVPDDEERSGDFVGSGVIKYVEPGNALTARLRDTPTDRLHNLYAEQGYWYDAIENLSQRIHHAGTGDKTFRLHRAALLRQVNLPLAAAYDSL